MKWEEDLTLVDELLIDDVRNNSAWNQRWFVTHRGLKSAPFSLDNAENEVQYAIQKSSLDPYNESPWRYLIAIIKEQFRLIGGTEDFAAFVDACENSVLETKVTFEETTKKDGKECTHLISAYIDILEMKGDEDSLDGAVKFAHDLETRYDPIRKKYWKMRANQLQQSL